MTFLQLGLVTTLLGYAALFQATAVAQWDPADRGRYYVFLLVAALVGACAAGSRRTVHRGALFWLAVMLPVYVGLQCIPLPAAVLEILSPARAELLKALVPITGSAASAPLTVRISQTTTHLFLMTAYMLVFLAGWQCAANLKKRVWLAVLPVVIVAVFQALIGLSQAVGVDGYAHGAYPVRNHFAGFMEMAFPFGVAYLGVAGATARREGRVSFETAIQICVSGSIALLILVAALSSLSRMAPLACFAALLVMGILTRSRTAGMLAIAAAVAFAILAPPDLVARFATSFSSGRVPVWRDTLNLIRAYPLFGCGMGGYESAFLKFKTSEFLYDQDYAHNDYLQLLSELGVVGFSIGAAFGVALLARLRRSLANPARRWLALACAGSLTAILVHSAVDFNLYVPANATLLAWICGVAAVQVKRETTSSSAEAGPEPVPTLVPL